MIQKRRNMKMIRIKRVGNISMGLVLIAFGVILFLSQFSGISVLKTASGVWPLILILLGIEILWCRYASKDENTAIKYDLFSIFTVLVILMFNLGIYAAEETGIMNRVQQMFLSEHYNIDVSLNEYVIDDGLKKIIIDDTDNLVIRSSDNNRISGIAKLYVYALSKKDAEDLSSSEHLRYKKSGDTLYIYSVSNKENNYSYSMSKGTELFIPQNVEVEIMNCRNIDLIYADFSNKWTIDGVNTINIRLDKMSDVRINAFVESIDRLYGNIKWSFDSFGEYTNGEGENLINILNSDNVVVNEV